MSKHRQMMIPFSPPDIGESEIKEVADALRSGWITTGNRTKLLERRITAFIETGDVTADCDSDGNRERYANRTVCLSSATAAEELILRLIGIGPGDEVIVPAYTYTASASAVIHCGAKPVFVDIIKNGDPFTYMPEMDCDQLAEAINEKTKAIVAVDIGGVVCDYERLFAIAEEKRGLFRPKEDDGSRLGTISSRIQHELGRVAIIADSAHSLGAKRMFRGHWRYCGNLADFTSFSFHAVKNFTTGEGGAATWIPLRTVSNKEIYDIFQLLSLHGQNKDALAKSSTGGNSWEYDIIGPWFKCNMTDIMAAIGLRQLDRYPGLIDRRKELTARYDAVCEELGIRHMIHSTSFMSSSNHLYLIRIDDASEAERNSVIERFTDRGVSTNVHYKPLPMMSAYKELGWDIKDFPNSYDYYRNLITLPLYSLMSDDEVEYVCDVMRELIISFRENS